MNMNRRETLKSLLLAPLGAGIASAAGCAGGGRANWTELPREYSYGRTAAERQRDRELFAERYFSEHELVTIATLCDIILPSDHPNGGALDAGLPDFVEFIVKDMDYLKTPARDGIAWLDSHAIDAYGADFTGITEAQRLAICDRIAWPDVADPALQAGIRFFSLMRDLTLTGYYTTAQGFRDLGYQGNVANVWDGVPAQVLARHGLAYEAEWLEKCIDQSRRDITAAWDDDMNLTS